MIAARTNRTRNAPGRLLMCPLCAAPGACLVVDSRAVLRPNAIRRRRQCQSCLKRFTTYEVFARDIDERVRFDPTCSRMVAYDGTCVTAIAMEYEDDE
jgi:hypothetical protein